MITEVEKIYFDMDGVLADFDKGVKELCGITPADQNGEERPELDNIMWAEIKMIDHFYDVLEIMPGGKEMFDALYGKYGDKCEILTGIPKPKRGIADAAEDKKRWVKRLLSEDIKVNIVFSEEKSQYCKSKGCILIDDRLSNVNDWNAMGGTGILHVSAKKTMEKLKELGVITTEV